MDNSEKMLLKSRKIGEIIKKRRLEKNLDIKSLVASTGCDILEDIENGQSSIRSLKVINLIILSNYLTISAPDLLIFLENSEPANKKKSPKVSYLGPSYLRW